MPLSADQLDDFSKLLELGLAGELLHLCLGRDADKLQQARYLRLGGFVTNEDGPLGPMVTRTFRGSELVRAMEQREWESAGFGASANHEQ